MTEKKPMAKETDEDKVDELVAHWIEQNPAEFTIDGKAGSERLRYRKRAIERHKQYKNAPDYYLKTMLKVLPETFKWYFNILQAVVMVGTVGFTTTFSILFINNLLSWIQESIVTQKFSTQWTGWVLPLIVILPIALLALTTNQQTHSSWLSYLIQHKLRIVHNLTELKIAMYYISKIIEIREAKKKGKHQL